MFICFKRKNNLGDSNSMAANNAMGGWLGAKLLLKVMDSSIFFFFGGGGWDSDSFCL
jgi:hypothetical protein